MTTTDTIILGIESSCDETAIALLRNGEETLASFVASQNELHRPFGGVVPEIACRAHMEVLIPGLQSVLDTAEVLPQNISAIAVTNGPGLIGALLVGVSAAKALALAWDKPLIGVNHIEAHIAASRLQEPDIAPPYIALVVSGGHTSIFHVSDWDQYTLISSTRDDAAGEAFDKVAKILELGFPGGPAVEQAAARNGNPKAYTWQNTCLPKGDKSFSFSGIKTAVLYAARGNKTAGKGPLLLDEQGVADAAASFQHAVAHALVTRTLQAARTYDARWIAVGGGVAANGYLREMLRTATQTENCRLVIPPMELCTDNAVMIAVRGHELYTHGIRHDLNLDAYARR